MNTTTSSSDSASLSGTNQAPRESIVRRALRRFLSTEAAAAPAIARLALGVMIVPHGAQKLLGWLGGYGFEGTMNFFTQQMGIPWPFAFAAILAEFFGGLALVAGLGVRLAAGAVGGVMAVAMITVHWQHGFFMNWFGNQKGEGVEFFVLALALAAIGVVSGGGALSLDRSFSRGR